MLRCDADDLFLLPAVLAYLDPGAGSLLLQLLVAGAAGLAVFLRLQGRRLLALLRRRRKGDSDGP